MPDLPQPTSDERELLLGFLEWKRQQVIAKADGLDEAQARWTPDGGLLPIIGVVNHLAHVEKRWIDGRFLGKSFAPRGEEFVLGDDITLAEVVAAYRSRAAETDRIVRDASSMEEPCLGCEGDGPPAHVILGLSAPVDLRWAVLHLIEETSQHAGHADSTRELLDGLTGY